jgi:hypothetical protein
LGDLNYGFDIDGIIGSGLLEKMAAIIDHSTNTLLAKNGHNA